MEFTHRCNRFTVLLFVLIIAIIASGQPSAANNNWTVIAPGNSTPTEQTSRVDDDDLFLARGTPYETRYYVNDSGKSGPTVLVVGGVHGNETAGYMAARRLASVTPTRGKLIVIPEANVLGIRANARIGGHPGDLNRHFPKTRSQKPSSPLAESIWDLIQRMKPDYVFDLHEGYDCHKINPKSVGQTIIYYPKGDTNKVARAMQSAVNSTIRQSGHKYSLIKYPIKGSMARAAGMFTSAQSMILETSRKQPLDVRIEQHVTMVNAALRHLGMRS